jgi:hypothetical protein
MALVTVVKFVLTFALGFMIFIFLGPLVYNARYGMGLWDDLPVNIQAYGDNLYGIWILIIVILAAILLITAWREAERKAAFNE